MPSTNASTAISKSSRNTLSPESASSCKVMLKARPEMLMIPTMMPAAAPIRMMSSETRPDSMIATAICISETRLPR